MTTADQAWRSTIKHLMHLPTFTVSPRNQVTNEILHDQITIDMNYPIVTLPARRIGYRFMAGEAAWILSGRNDVAGLAKYSNHVQAFSDDGSTFFGAYGPKIIDQLAYVRRTLQNDPSSRQAVINIWRENPGYHRDIPCTLSCQFLIRDDTLHTFVNMRSSDIWLGVPYDLFSFTMVSASLIVELGWPLKLGTLTQFAGSRHLYERNFDGAARVIEEGRGVERPYRGLAECLAAWRTRNDIIDHLFQIADNKRVADGTWMSETQGWRKL